MFMCWIALTEKKYGRKPHSGKLKYWAPCPTTFPPIAFKTVNDALQRAGLQAWQQSWETINHVSSHLLRGTVNDAEVDEMLKVVADEGFWSRSSSKASGQLVGLALLDRAELSSGPLSWSTPEHRFWQRVTPETFQSRLCFFRVLDVVAIGSFASDELEPHASDDVLVPVAVASRTPRRILFDVTQLTAQTWQDLPCLQFQGVQGAVPQRPRRAIVAEVIAGWQRQHGPTLSVESTTAMRVWPPVAAALIHKQWSWLALSPPKLEPRRNRDRNINRGDNCHNLFKHVDFDNIADGNVLNVFHTSVAVDNVLSKDVAVVRCRSMCSAIRKWAPHVIRCEDSADDFSFSSAFLEEMANWFDHYADALDCPQQHNVERSRGINRFQYKAVSLIRYLLMSRLITDNDAIPEVMKNALKIALPDVLMEYCVDALNKRVPVKGTLSKHLVTLDVAYCQLWHAKWKSLCAQEASVFFMADSSPQFGSNWLLKRCTIVKDIAKAVEVQEKMVSLLPTDRGDDEKSWNMWLEELTTTDLSHMKKKKHYSRAV